MMLQEEKQRVNYLLSLFLPESQVWKWKVYVMPYINWNGKNVKVEAIYKNVCMPPERYDHCTIFNSDIVGFTKISKVWRNILSPAPQNFDIQYAQTFY